MTPPRPVSRFSLPAALVRERIAAWSCAGVAAVLVGVQAMGFSPGSCPFLTVTGLPCPGCGLTRSCACLLRGQFRQSLDYHAFGPLFLGIGILGLVGTLLPPAPRQRLTHFLQHWDDRVRFTLILAAAWAVYTVIRWI